MNHQLLKLSDIPAILFDIKVIKHKIGNSELVSVLYQHTGIISCTCREYTCHVLSSDLLSMGDPTKSENDTKSSVEEDGGMDEEIELNENDVEEVIVEDDGELHSGERLIVVLAEILIMKIYLVFISYMIGLSII